MKTKLRVRKKLSTGTGRPHVIHANGKHGKNGSANGHKKNGSLNGHKKIAALVHREVTDEDFFNVLTRLRNGDFSQRLPVDQDGMKRSLCDVINEIIDFSERMVSEFDETSKNIGKQGDRKSVV